MSDYWAMWSHIKELSPRILRWWCDRTARCRGEVLFFAGRRYLDHDLHEAISNYLEDVDADPT